jgi:flavin reductase (DIM6/NTAB) family NADH-FMN oxidoreductase RutF
MDAQDCDADAFVDGLNYSMLLVTVRDGDTRSGCLIGFSTQTSINPFRYLVCLSRKNATTRVAMEANHLAVHQIGEDQVELSKLFGEQTGDEIDKFAHCDWVDGPAGVPLLTGCPAWLVGRIEARFILGDHQGMLLAPVAAGREREARSITFATLPPMDPGHGA